MNRTSGCGSASDTRATHTGPGCLLAAASSTASKLRFVAKGLKSHRDRLGLSAADYGRLVGVSAQSIYNWETKVAVPRRSMLPRIAQLRGKGKREVADMLGR